MKFGTTIFAGAVAMLIAGSANAVLTAISLGTAAPPAQLGGSTMTAFPLDPQPFTVVNSVASPLGGSVGFSQGLNHVRIGQGWGSWSHGYTGDVYYGIGMLTVTLTLPANTGAFYLYVEGNNFTPPADFLVTANNAQGNQTMFNLNQVAGQAGAAGVGFVSSSAMTTITVTSVGISPNGFAVGEFGIALVVPAPGAFALLGLSGMISRRRRA